MNKRTFEECYTQNFEGIYRFFILRSLSKENAEDLTSLTFMTFAEVLSKRTKINNARNYLFGIAKIKFIEYLKAKYEEVPIEMEKLDMITETLVSENITKDRYLLGKYLDNLINRLPLKQKILMRLRIKEKLKLSAIAKKLGKDINYVKTTQRRAIKNLKEFAAKMYTH